MSDVLFRRKGDLCNSKCLIRNSLSVFLLPGCGCVWLGQTGLRGRARQQSMYKRNHLLPTRHQLRLQINCPALSERGLKPICYTMAKLLLLAFAAMAVVCVSRATDPTENEGSIDL